jgi:alpha-glucosidase
MLALTRALVELRRAEPALSTGDWAPLPVTNILAFTRKAPGKQFIIALELESRAADVDLGFNAAGRVALSTHAGRKGETIGRRFALRADEALVIEVTG